MLNNLSEFYKYKKKFLLSMYNKNLDEANKPISKPVFDFITGGPLFSITQSSLTVLYFTRYRKLPLSTLKPHFTKYCIYTFVNMEFFFRNHKQEYPFQKEKDLSNLKKFLIAVTGPGFCIMKDINILRLIIFFKSFIPESALEGNKMKSQYKIIINSN